MENSIEIPIWWSNGSGSSYRRDSLPPDHPQHTYNYIKDQLKLIPEDYGILHPTAQKYESYTREELIAVISQLENGYGKY